MNTIKWEEIINGYVVKPMTTYNSTLPERCKLLLIDINFHFYKSINLIAYEFYKTIIIMIYMIKICFCQHNILPQKGFKNSSVSLKHM